VAVQLECHDLSFSYRSANGSLAALQDVRFTVADHEFVAIVGPSGCGKTTLLKLVAGLRTPTSGRITIRDARAGAQPSSALVFQDHGLFPWMTVLDNVAFGLEMLGVGPKERRDTARAFADRIGLSRFVNAYPHELSVGMQQRVGIARAFVTDPPLLLMDEPFGALDSQMRIVLQEELLRIWSDQPKVVLFVTHDIDEAIRLSDRILVMTGRPGRIREEIPVPIPRPRALRAGDLSDASELKWHVWTLLQHDVRQSLGIAE
jgi:NitT/TauT family transport system ATP-binding protein